MSNQTNNGEDNEQSTLTAVERPYATSVIEFIHPLIVHSYEIRRVFFKGSLQDALHSAFVRSLVKKRRPLLIYIHHNDRILNPFSSETMIEFLAENYIVWPWDISSASNRQILTQTWEVYFSKESFIRFSKNQCPMLIAIKRQLSMRNNSSVKYEIEVLLQSDVLVRTDEQLNLETLLCELIVFKKEFDKNEQFLSCDFVQKIASCPELALEIAEYLSLNDAVATFSMDILPLLWQCDRKLPVIKPSEEFIRAISQNDEHNKIISLRLEASQFKQILSYASSQTFTNVRSMTISNLQEMREIFDIRVRFPALAFLWLRYDWKIDFQKVCKIFNLIPSSIKRLDIHCHSISCSHHRLDHLFTRVNNLNKNVESFVLHVNQISQSLLNTCAQAHKKCLLKTIIDFIEIMSNIQYVRIHTGKGSLETLLNVVEWMNLTEKCSQLKKINLTGMRNILHDVQLDRKIQEIGNSLHDVRESIKFEVQVK